MCRTCSRARERANSVARGAQRARRSSRASCAAGLRSAAAAFWLLTSTSDAPRARALRRGVAAPFINAVERTLVAGGAADVLLLSWFVSASTPPSSFKVGPDEVSF